jgi:uncharacterized protein (TIGR03066 family)
MKLSAKLAALKKRKQTKPAVRPTGAKFTSRFWACLVLALVATGAGTLGVFEFFIWNKVPPALVGKWQVEDGALGGGTFEFFRNGNLVILHKNQNQDASQIKGRAFVEGKTLHTTMRNPVARRDQTQTITIIELTANSLILEFENGDVLRMVR